jgi:hypothetical protein
VGPILEVLDDTQLRVGVGIEVVNPELQPAAEVRRATPILHLERRDIASDHFTSNRLVELNAVLDFEYPTPHQNSNVIFLPDRAFEGECAQLLASLGFSTTSEKRRFILGGDDALDFIQESHERLGKGWKLVGFDAIKKGIRFSNLSISVALSGGESPEAGASKRGTKGFGMEWFDCHVSVLQNNSNLPLSSLFKNARGDNDRWARLDSGAYARVPGGTVSQLRTILGMIDPNCRVSNTIRAELSLAQAISLSRIQDSGFKLSLDKKLAALSNKLASFSEIKPVKASKRKVLVGSTSCMSSNSEASLQTRWASEKRSRLWLSFNTSRTSVGRKTTKSPCSSLRRHPLSPTGVTRSNASLPT